MEKKESNLKVIKDEPKKYVKEAGKIYNEDLELFLGMLKGLPEKNPIAFELSRAMKSGAKAYEAFNENKEGILANFLLRDEEGKWVLSDEATKALEKDPKARVTIFDYVAEEGKEDEYRTALVELFKAEADITLKSVNATEKMVKLEDGTKEPLIEVISDYFGSGQITFLENVNILTGLD